MVWSSHTVSTTPKSSSVHGVSVGTIGAIHYKADLPIVTNELLLEIVDKFGRPSRVVEQPVAPLDIFDADLLRFALLTE